MEAIVCLHVLNESYEFRLDGTFLWGEGERPDVDQLAICLGQLLKFGSVREDLVVLLWQVIYRGHFSTTNKLISF